MLVGSCKPMLVYNSQPTLSRGFCKKRSRVGGLGLLWKGYIKQPRRYFFGGEGGDAEACGGIKDGSSDPCGVFRHAEDGFAVDLQGRRSVKTNRDFFALQNVYDVGMLDVLSFKNGRKDRQRL